MCVCVFPSLDCIVEKKVASQRPMVPSSPVRTGIKNTKMLYLRMPKPISGFPPSDEDEGGGARTRVPRLVETLSRRHLPGLPPTDFFGWFP